MSTPKEYRRTTSDPLHLKVLRVKGALLTPELACKSNRELGRMLQVDEKMVRNWRSWAAQFTSQLEDPKPAPKKDAGKKGKKSE